MVGGKVGLELAAIALAHTNPEVRRVGTFGAYRAHGERALPLIEKALGDGDEKVRKEAARGLENIRQTLAATNEKAPTVLQALKDAEARMKK